MSYDYGSKFPSAGTVGLGSTEAPSRKESSGDAKVQSAAHKVIENRAIPTTPGTSDRVIAKMNPAALRSGVARVAQQRALTTLSQTMKRTMGTTGNKYVMQPLGSSANPVTRLKSEQFIPASILQGIGSRRPSSAGKTPVVENTLNNEKVPSALSALRAFSKTAVQESSKLPSSLQNYVKKMADEIDSGKHEMFEKYFKDSSLSASDLHEEIETMSWETLIPDADDLEKADSKVLKEFFKQVKQEYQSTVADTKSTSETQAAETAPSALSALRAFSKTALQESNKLPSSLQNYVKKMADDIGSGKHEMFEKYFKDSSLSASDLHEEIETMSWETLIPDADDLEKADSKVLKEFFKQVKQEYQAAITESRSKSATLSPQQEAAPQVDLTMEEFGNQVKSIAVNMGSQQSPQLKTAFGLAATPIFKFLREKETHMKEKGNESGVAADYKEAVITSLSEQLQNPKLTHEVRGLLTTWKSQVESMPTSVELQGVPLRYDKEGVLANLQRMEGELLPDVLKELRSLPDRYISTSDLDMAAAKLGITISALTRNLEPFYSTFELESAAKFSGPSRQMIKTKMETLTASQTGGAERQTTLDRPGFAFKLGVENHREILAGKVVKTLNLDNFYTMKLEQTFDVASLGNENSPSGIASKWLEDATLLSRQDTTTMFKLNAVAKAPTQWPANESREILTGRLEKFSEIIPATFRGWLQEAKSAKTADAKAVAIAKLQLLQKGMVELEKSEKSTNREITTILKEARAAFPQELTGLTEISDAELHQLLKEGWYDTYSKFMGPYEGTIYSSQALALSDALLLTNDGHEEQYMFARTGDTTHIECIDQARHLSPSESYTKDGQTYIAIRSTMLDSPTLDEPIPTTLKEIVNSLDPAKIGADLRKAGVVVSDDKLAEARQERAAIRDQLDKIDSNRMKQDEAQELCAKYNIRGSGDLLPALRIRLMGEVTAKTTYMYQHMSEKSLAALQDRASKAKEFLASDKQPKTMRELVNHTLPEVSIIARALVKLTDRPFLSINIRPREGILQTNSLEYSLQQLEKLEPPLPKEELDEVRQAIIALKNKACDLGEVLQCMNAA